MVEEKYVTLKDTYKKIVSTRGILGLYRGFWVTFNRDIFSYGLYFFTFFALKDSFEENNKLNSFNIMLAGGLAGGDFNHYLLSRIKFNLKLDIKIF